MKVGGWEIKNVKEKFNKEKLKEQLRAKLRSFFKGKEDNIVSSPKEKNVIFRSLFLLLGTVYWIYCQGSERFRIIFFNFLNDLKATQIAIEFIKHSLKLILLVIITIFIAVIFSVLHANFAPTISDELIKNLLTAYITGMTALLGILFALYSVGFQITTARYSSKVTEYINQERVGRFFFQLLVFTTIAILFVLILQNTTDIPLVYGFLGTTFLTTFCLLGILTYKDDYITKLKPRSIFQLIYNQNFNDLELVNKYDSPEISGFRLTKHPRVKSFRLSFPIHKSWSILSALQKNTQSRIKIHKILFNDLAKTNSFEDASFGITALGYTLIKYSEIKPYIEKDVAWWFPRFEEIVKSDDPSMFPIKANYESQGIGILHQTKINFNWLEDEIVKELERIQNDDELLSHNEITNALIYSYEIILSGKYEKTNLGYEKKMKGLFELQNFELFEKILKLYFQLGAKIKEDGIKANYINTLGEIKTTITDGFSTRYFPGKLKDWRPSFEANVKKLYKVKRETDMDEWKQPEHFNYLLTESWREINVEKIVEGKYITTPEWLLGDLLKNAIKTEAEMESKYTKMLLTHIISLTSSGDKYYSNNLSLLILHLFNQLISSNKWSELNQIVVEYRVELFKSLATIDSESFVNLELRDPIDFGLFTSLVERQKEAYKFYLTLFFLTQIYMSANVDKTNIPSIVKLARRPLIIGSLAYLVSELDQDSYYLDEALKHLESLYGEKLTSVMSETKDILTNVGTATLSQVIWDEANRYRGYYRDVINSIFELPPRYETHGSGLYGFTSTQTVEHPSAFIRQMAVFRLSDMDECYEGFVEYLEKREQIKKLISVLKGKKT